VKHIKWREFKLGIFFLATQTFWLLASMYKFVVSGGINYEALGEAIGQGFVIGGLLVPNKYGLYTACFILFSNIPLALYQLGAEEKTLTTQELRFFLVWVPIYLWYFYKRKHWWGLKSVPAINGALEAAPALPSSDSPSPVVRELQKKAWFRFCKLAYVFGYIVSLTVAVVIGYSEFPVEYIDSDESIVVCASGSRHSARAISDYFYSSELNSLVDEKARKLCTSEWAFEQEVRLADDRTFKMGIPSWANLNVETSKITKLIEERKITDVFDIAALERKYTDYIFIPSKAVRGSYATLLWGLGIVVLAGGIIRRSFLYVVAGVPFFRSPLRR